MLRAGTVCFYKHTFQDIRSVRKFVNLDKRNLTTIGDKIVQLLGLHLIS